MKILCLGLVPCKIILQYIGHICLATTSKLVMSTRPRLDCQYYKLLRPVAHNFPRGEKITRHQKKGYGEWR
uniref:Uncharacterized protein n=1 Tax=Rhizophora mucronata TaxID=61149 RepID=A0A2P2R075_RHIMU